MKNEDKEEEKETEKEVKNLKTEQRFKGQPLIVELAHLVIDVFNITDRIKRIFNK
jgi:hypothetical protein